MADKIDRNSDMKIVLRPNGLLKDFINILPNGKKNAILSQILLDSILQDRIFHSLVISIGQKDANKVKNKVSKLFSGVIMDNKSILLDTNSIQDIDINDFMGKNTLHEEEKNKEKTESKKLDQPETELKENINEDLSEDFGDIKFDFSTE